MLDQGHCMLDQGHCMLDQGHCMLDQGHCLLDQGHCKASECCMKFKVIVNMIMVTVCFTKVKVTPNQNRNICSIMVKTCLVCTVVTFNEPTL